MSRNFSTSTAAEGDPDAIGLDAGMRAVDALVDGRNFRGAIDLLRRVLARHPEHPRAHYLLGHLLGFLGDQYGALEACIAAVRLAPEDATAHRLLAGVLRKRSRSHRQALAHAREALRLAPEDGWAHFELALLQVAMCRPGYARRSLRDAAERAPNEPVILATAAECLFAMCRAKEGRDYAARAYAADPGSGMALAAEARSCLTLGRHADARDLARAAMAIEATYGHAIAAFIEAEMCRNPFFAAWSRLKGWSQGGRLRGTVLLFAACLLACSSVAAAGALSDEAGYGVMAAWFLLALAVGWCGVRLRHRIAAADRPVAVGRRF